MLNREPVDLSDDAALARLRERLTLDAALVAELAQTLTDHADTDPTALARLLVARIRQADWKGGDR